MIYIVSGENAYYTKDNPDGAMGHEVLKDASMFVALGPNTV